MADRVALVTGANTGIGLAIAVRLLADGYSLAYATQAHDERHEEPFRELQASYGDAVRWLWGDLADPSTPEQIVAQTVENLGRIDVLVNNAGLGAARPFLELTLDDFERTFDVDVRASFLLTQQAARRMRNDGGGCVINITSVHEHVPRPNLAVYAAAKAALGMLTRGAALELAQYGIRVNAVAPGVIATPRNEEDAQKLDREVPLRRPGRPEEVASLVAWLASDEASYVTGASYLVDGGMSQQVVNVPAG